MSYDNTRADLERYADLDVTAVPFGQAEDDLLYGLGTALAEARELAPALVPRLTRQRSRLKWVMRIRGSDPDKRFAEEKSELHLTFYRMEERIETETEQIIKHLGAPWVPIPISKGDTRCDPFYGMRSRPYIDSWHIASWHNPKSSGFLCSVCLLHDLRNCEEHAMTKEVLRNHLCALEQEAQSMAHRVDALRRYVEKKFPTPLSEMPF